MIFPEKSASITANCQAQALAGKKHQLSCILSQAREDRAFILISKLDGNKLTSLKRTRAFGFRVLN